MNYFGQSFESFKTIAVLIILILTNNELLIRIENIRIIISRIYKGIELNNSVNIIDFRSNNREAVDVTCYTLLESIILRIKNIEYKKLQIDYNRAYELYDSEFYIL